MREKIRFYRPAAAAFLVMMAMSLTCSTLSFFLEPVCEAMQVGRGSFSLVFSLITVSGAVTNPFLGQYAGKKGVKRILLVSGIWVWASMVLFSLAKHLWMIYLAGFLMGAFATNCVALCANVIVQQSYEGAKASGILGVVMAGSGVGGMLFNILIPAVMTAVSWQRAMQVMGICWLVLLWAAALVLGQERLPGNGQSGNGAGGMTRAEALRSPRLYLQILVIIIVTACCGIQQQQPSLLGSYGMDSQRVSLLLSIQTGCLAVGKILQGLLYGKLGIRRGGCLMLLIFSAGMAALLHTSLIYPGLLLLALGFGVYTTLMPLVARRVFGAREYAAIWSIIATAGSVGTFVANPVWGTVYDISGSYGPGLIVGALLLLAAAGALHLTLPGEP